jgi:hypothetical protein
MMKLMPTVFITALLGAFLHATAGQAQSSRTFVSAATGNDANNCDIVATPCRTFQAAHDKTNSDGEITVLGPGGYGAVKITKSISIVNDGAGEASILVSGGAIGITINAGAASYINLRGITIQGIGFGGGIGLRFNSGFSLTMTNCVVRNHTGPGILFVPTVDSNLAISNTLLADNGGSGVYVEPDGSAKVALTRVEAYNNSQSGLALDNTDTIGPGHTISASVTDSVIANNGGIGLFAFSTSTAGHAVTNLMVIRSVSANNSTGIAATGPVATVRVGQTTITGNATAWAEFTGGTVRSYNDNNIDGNTGGDPGPITILRK